MSIKKTDDSEKKPIQNRIGSWIVSDPKVSVPAIMAIIVAIILGAYMVVDRMKVEQPVATDPIDTLATIVNIAPSNALDGLIGTGATFKILTAPETTIASLQKSIVLHPAVPFTIKTLSTTEFELAIREPLAKGSLLNIAYSTATGPTSRAFQVAGQLRLVNSYPADASVAVPQNSGIELTFNEAIDQSIMDYVTITPSLQMKATVDGNTVIIRSTAGLAKDTQYILTVKSGYKSPVGGELNEAITRSFFTGTQSAFDMRTIKTLNLFQDNEPHYLPLATYMPAPEYTVTVYPLDSVGALKERALQYESLQTQYLQPEKYLASLAASPLFKGVVSPVSLSEFSYTKHLQIPQLPIGSYWIECVSSLGTQVSFVQVSPYALYTEFDESLNQHLFWLLNASTSKPVSATFYSTENLGNAEELGTALAKTDNDGTAKVIVSSGAIDLLIKGDDASIWIPKDGFDGDSQGYPNESNWRWSGGAAGEEIPAAFRQTKSPLKMHFLYTDRQVYLKGESVNVFGIFKTTDQTQLSTIFVRLLSDLGASEIKEVPLNEVGGFSLELSSSEIGAFDGWRSIEIGSDQGYIASTGINVESFEKPEISISLKSEKEVYGPGEDIQLSGSVEHMDGSPMKNYGLELNGYGLSFGDGDTQTSTDSFGHFTKIFKPNFNPQMESSSPQNFYLNVKNAGTENVEVSASTNIMIFPSPIILDSKDITGNLDGLVSFEVTANALNLPDTQEESYMPESYKGEGLSLDFSYQLEESYTEAILNGTVYDPIFKVDVPQYDYKNHANIVDTGSFKTNSGKFIYQYPTIAGRSYKLMATTLLNDGTPIKTWAYHYTPEQASSAIDSIPTNSESEPLFEAKKHILTNPEWMPTMPNRIDFEPDVPFTLTLNVPDALEAITPPERAKTLFVRYSGQYFKHRVISGIDPVYSDVVKDEELPSAIVKAVFYDGFRFQNSIYEDKTVLKLKSDAKRLEVIMTPDQPVYSPGSVANVKVQLLADGEPQVGAIWLGVVDKAYFQLYPETTDAHASFYAVNYRTGVSRSFNTSKSTIADMAEMGEGGGDDGLLREDFKNTAYTGYMMTDKSGIATFSFKLPDNITSWRLTAHANTSNGLVGTKRNYLPSTLPFYLRYLSVPLFTVKDLPSILVTSRISNADGALLNSDINYHWLLERDGSKVSSSTVTAPYNEYAAFGLKDLKVGKYDLLIDGKHPENPLLKDRVKLPINVVNSKVSFDATSGSVLKSGEEWESQVTDHLSNLMVWHAEANAWRSSLMDLTHADSRRLEFYLSSLVASAQLSGEDENSDIPEDAFDAFRSGLYKPLLNAEVSGELTADVVALLPKYHSNKTDLLAYLALNEVNYEKMDEAIALLRIKSSLKQPVLYTLHNLAKQKLTAHQRLSLAWAFIEIGDLEMAKDQWTQLSESLAMTANDPIRLQYLRAIIAQALNLEEASTLYSQALDLTPKKHTYQLLQLNYLIHQQQEMDPITFNYQIFEASAPLFDPKEVIVTGNTGIPLTLKPNQTVKISDSIGNLDLVYHYKGNLDTVVFDTSPPKMTRTFDKTQLSLDQVVVVTLKTEQPKLSTFQLIETIPSGFNASTVDGTVQGNQIVFYTRPDTGQQVFRYTLKPRLTGTFVSEPSILIQYSQSPSTFPIYNKGLETTLEITP